MTAAIDVLKCQDREVLGDLADGLVQLAQQRLRQRRGGRGRGLTSLAAHGFAVAHAQAVDPAEEAAYPGDSVFLPIQVAVRRRGKKRVHTGGV